MKNKYYTIEKNHNGYIVWFNVEHKESDHGSYGSYPKFKGTLKECRNYCKENNIKLKEVEDG